MQVDSLSIAFCIIKHLLIIIEEIIHETNVNK